MSVDLVETRLGLRTPEMQADSMACLQRIMAHAHVIQLCREHTPKNGKEGEFPLVVRTFLLVFLCVGMCVGVGDAGSGLV